MTFERFWEENYEKDFGKCEPYYGIASYAFEVGKSFSHGDELETVEKTAERKSISEIISELENIKNEYGDFPLNYVPSVFKEYKQLVNDNKILREKVSELEEKISTLRSENKGLWGLVLS